MGMVGSLSLEIQLQIYSTISADSRNAGVALHVASSTMYVHIDPRNKCCNAHCGWSYAFSARTHVYTSSRSKSLIAWNHDSLGAGDVASSQYAFDMRASLKKPNWHKNHEITVTAAAGKTSRPVRLNELFARPDSASLTFPARDCWVALSEFTKPSRTKNIATAAFPCPRRRRKGRWNSFEGPSWPWDGGTMLRAKQSVRWLETTKREAMPRRPW